MSIPEPRHQGVPLDKLTFWLLFTSFHHS